MGRVSIVMALVVAGGCGVDELPSESAHAAVLIDHVSAETFANDPDAPDICALAAELPADDLCSLACDPDALRERMIADGMTGGRCYSFRCTYRGDVSATLGVCLQ